jgi:hypothetical protein
MITLFRPVSLNAPFEATVAQRERESEREREREREQLKARCGRVSL